MRLPVWGEGVHELECATCSRCAALHHRIVTSTTSLRLCLQATAPPPEAMQQDGEEGGEGEEDEGEGDEESGEDGGEGGAEDEGAAARQAGEESDAE